MKGPAAALKFWHHNQMKKQKHNVHRIFGINNALAVLASERFFIRRVELQKNGRAEKSEKLLNLINKSDASCQLLQKQDFLRMYGGVRSQGVAVEFSGIVLAGHLPDFSRERSTCLLALDQVEDPQNLGQIIRTAECAGVDGLLLPKHHSAPITDAVLQVSQGAFATMPLYEVTNLREALSRLKDTGFWVVGLENSIAAKHWHKIDYKEKIVIVIGSEGKGIREKVIESCDFKATIPMQGNTNSLNVSAAAAAILFERLRQINKE